MTTPRTSPEADRLARRYGRRPTTRPATNDDDGAPSRSSLGRRAAWIGSAGVAAIITAIVVAINVTGQEPVATAQVLSYEVTSPARTVAQVAVTRPDATVPVTCAVEAVDGSLAQVGARTFEVPAAAGRGHTATFEVEIATYARAEQARALENGCFAVVD